MEEDHKKLMKHVCKFCSKSFPCGRSLGGHMRSHMTTAETTTTTTDHKNKLKLNVVSVNYSNTESNLEEEAGYILREKPKKTWRLTEEEDNNNVNTTAVDKVCKECGKAFQSWKALFGHMKCHSNKEKGCSDHQLVMMDSQSDNETAVAAAPSNNKGRRSRRSTTTRYNIMGTSTDDDDDDDQQGQEEVALSLMMLSRDVGGFNSVITESSDNNNSVFLEAEIQIKKASISCKKTMKKKKKKLESSEALVQTEFGVSENGVFRVNKKSRNELDGHQLNSSKRKLLEDQVQHFDGHKRSKFECSTCNKIFHSYQALGGHRASHRKIKGCFASRIDHISTTENSIETENSPITNNKLIFKSVAAAAESDDIKADEVLSYDGVIKKSSKGNECPICLKVFPSGQALGGHKRSHLVSDQPKDDQTIVIQKPIHKIRDFLDLNLPAPDEDETSSFHVGFNQPWWIGSSHKHEALVGFISN